MASSPAAPAILVAGRGQAARAGIARLLEESGFLPVQCEATAPALAAAAVQNDFQLIVSVDVPEREGRALLRVRQAEERARERLRDMTHLHEIATRLAKTLDLQPTLEEVLAAVLELQQAPLGVLFLLDEGRRALVPAATIGLSQTFLERIGNLTLGLGASGRSAAEHRAIVIEDVQTDPDYSPFLDLARDGSYRSIFSRAARNLGPQRAGRL